MCRRCTVAALIAALVLAGCPGPGEGDRDAGARDGAADEPARLTVAHRVQALDTIVEETGVPVDLGDGWTLHRLALGAAEVRARNDRDPAEHPVLADVGALELLGAPRDVVFESAPPATYAQVTLSVATGAWGPALAIEAEREGTRYRITGTSARAIELRCESGAMVLLPGQALRVVARVEAREVLGALVEDDLPPPVDGVIHVDAATAPAAAAAVELRLPETIELECDDEAAAAATEASER